MGLVKKFTNEEPFSKDVYRWVCAACLDHILQASLQAIITGRWKSLRTIKKIASQNSENRIVRRILQKQKMHNWFNLHNWSINLWRVKAKLYKKSSWADKQIWLGRNAHDTKSLIFLSYWSQILKLSAYTKFLQLFSECLKVIKPPLLPF